MAYLGAGTLSITNSTVASNTALGGKGDAVGGTAGGEADGGGVYSLADATTITASTLSQNTAQGGPGAGGAQDGFGSGGGAFLEGTDTIVNSTIALNTARGVSAAGGGIFFGKLATGQLTNDTVAANQTISSSAAGEGGGLDNNNGAIKPVTLVNTVVAGNMLNSLTNTPNADVRGEILSGGHNLIGVVDGANDPGFHLAGDLTGTAASPLDAKLGPLQNNGGPTQTMLPLPGSPLLGGGIASLAPTTDQRGLSRPGGGPTDIGAVQVTNVGGSSSPHTPVGQLLAFALGFVNGQLDILFVDQQGQVFDESFTLNNFFTPSPGNAQFLNTDMVFRNIAFSDALGYPAVLGNLLDSSNQGVLMITIPLSLMSQTALNDVIAALQAPGA